MSVKAHEVETVLWVLFQHLKKLDFSGRVTVDELLAACGPHRESLLYVASMFTADELLKITLAVLRRRDLIQWVGMQSALSLPGKREKVLQEVSRLRDGLLSLKKVA